MLRRSSAQPSPLEPYLRVRRLGSSALHCDWHSGARPPLQRANGEPIRQDTVGSSHSGSWQENGALRQEPCSIKRFNNVVQFPFACCRLLFSLSYTNARPTAHRIDILRIEQRTGHRHNLETFHTMTRSARTICFLPGQTFIAPPSFVKVPKFGFLGLGARVEKCIA